MPVIARGNHVLAGVRQCSAADPEEWLGRCRLVATHSHRRRVGDRVRAVALCPHHFELAGPEAAPTRP